MVMYSFILDLYYLCFRHVVFILDMYFLVWNLFCWHEPMYGDYFFYDIIACWEVMYLFYCRYLMHIFFVWYVVCFVLVYSIIYYPSTTCFGGWRYWMVGENCLCIHFHIFVFFVCTDWWHRA